MAEIEAEGSIPILPDVVIHAAWSNGSEGFASALEGIARHGIPELESVNRSREAARIVGGDVERSLAARLLRLHRAGRLALRVTGPISDGFWVRATTALAHARWASAAGLPVSIVYRSAFDNYDDSQSTDDGWTQYFETVRRDWPRAQLVGLSCAGSAIVARLRANGGGDALDAVGSGVYARTWAQALEQRSWRREAMKALPLQPKWEFLAATSAFWASFRVRPIATLPGRLRHHESTKKLPQHPILGLHLRGTDRMCSVEVEGYLPLIKAYLCHRPTAKIFVATDDNRLLTRLRDLLDGTPILAQSGVVRGSSRGRGLPGLNPGVHARGKRGTAPLRNGSLPATLGRDVMIDTLLLAQTDFLLGSISAITSFAILLSPRLHEQSFLWDLDSQPLPIWRNACTRRKSERPSGSIHGAWEYRTGEHSAL